MTPADPRGMSGDAAPSDRVLILGGGYGGLRTAQELGKALAGSGTPELVLVDRYPYHQVITELPVAATGRKGAEDFEYPLAELLEKADTRLVQAEIAAIDVPGRAVQTANGAISYGTLVVALGSVTTFYGVQGLAEHTLTLKSVDDAVAIRERVIQALGAAAQQPDGPARDALLTFVVGGGGLTGVELAGELADFVPRYAELQGLARHEPKILLVEGAAAVLPSMPQGLQVKAGDLLQDLGVDLLLGTRVTAADESGVTLSTGRSLPSRTVIWTGGIMAPPLLARSHLPTARNGQVLVDAYLRVPDHPEIYAIGDAAWIVEEGSTVSVVATAQNALEQAAAVAYNIYAGLQGYPARPYRAHDKGQVVSVGTERGVASIFHLALTGRKVLALKSLVQDGYRFEAARHLPFGN